MIKNGSFSSRYHWFACDQRYGVRRCPYHQVRLVTRLRVHTWRTRTTRAPVMLVCWTDRPTGRYCVMQPANGQTRSLTAEVRLRQRWWRVSLRYLLKTFTSLGSNFHLHR